MDFFNISNFCCSNFNYYNSSATAQSSASSQDSNPIIECEQNDLGHTGNWLNQKPKTLDDEIEDKIASRVNEVIKILISNFNGANDVAGLVASYIDVSDDIMKVLAKRLWNIQENEVTEKFKQLVKKVIMPDPELFPYDILGKKTDHFENIETLVMPPDTTDSDLTVIAQLKRLRSLSFEGCRLISNAAFSNLLQKLTDLQSLELSGCFEITDTGLANLVSFKNLKFLKLSDGPRIYFTDDALTDSVSHIPSLEHLDLSGCTKISDKGIASLTQLEALKFLKLPCSHTITNIGLSDLSYLPALESLDLEEWCFIKDFHLAILAKFPALQSLKLIDSSLTIATIRRMNLSGDCFLNRPGIKDASLKDLTDLKTLRHLSLINCHSITDVGINQLTNFPALVSIELSDCLMITNEGLTSLTHIKTLKSITLRNFENFTDKSLAILGGMTTLQSLELLNNGNHITGEGLKHLENLTITGSS